MRSERTETNVRVLNVDFASLVRLVANITRRFDLINVLRCVISFYFVAFIHAVLLFRTICFVRVFTFISFIHGDAGGGATPLL